ncbi:thiopurine S-methyltransferase [Methylomonas koyamae]|uniref:Thiopurine S-methyltransferase n=1 Tax=Methylomonas koyamae TaxID=702114 RepID=A0A291IDV4_9GAMM|nr:thiopurine S-methyltransferase [Methylomonas koyamae]ATG88367.1 Thiopurine S-methyltransferase [Methylomonas koyamae]OAI21945.1 thiopurine S-methyltransferase [Methylomonas koyamae]
MDANFWHEKWQRREIGFHQPQANPLLVAYFDKLNLAAGSRVLLPLCGKTRDIAWLLDRGFRVAGAELSKIAVEELFDELELAAQIKPAGPLWHYRADNIDLFVGDIFQLSAELLGPVDAVYDRAALVALPAEIRRKYAAHLTGLTAVAPQLLVAYEYDQLLAEGPPFSVVADEVLGLYAGSYRLTPLARSEVEGGLKGMVAAVEATWLLKKAD